MRCKKLILSAVLLVLFLCIGTVAYGSEAFVVPADGTPLRIEAEDSKGTVEYFIETKDADASGGLIMQMPDGFSTNSSVAVDDDPHLFYEFEVTEDTMYYFWQRVRSDAERATTNLWFRVDDGLIYRTDFTHQGWDWMNVTWIRLKPGKHTIKIYYRLDTISLDCLEITSDLGYHPNGGPRWPIYNGVPGPGGEIELPYNLPAYIPPDEHPRVLFRASDLPRIRENLEHPQNIETYKNLLAQADRDISGKQEALAYGATSNINTTIGGVCEANAFLYQLTGDKERGRKAIDIMKDYIHTSVVDPSVSDTPSRDGCLAVYNCAQVYDWCYDLLTEEEKVFLQDCMLYRLSQSEVGWPAINYNGFINGHGVEEQLIKDALAAGIAIYGDRNDLYNLVAGRTLNEVVPAHNITDNSIFASEGTSYGRYRFQFQLESAWLFHGMGYENIFTPQQQYSMYGYYYILRPDGRCISMGDNASEATWSQFYAPFNTVGFLAGNLYQDPYMKSFYYLSASNENGVATTSSAISPTKHLIMNDVSVGVANYEDLPLSAFSRYPQGYMAARTSWKNGVGSNAVVCLMNIQQKYLPNHQHMDSGHFDIYYKGSLAIDSGTYQAGGAGYGSKHRQNYTAQSIAHNTMLVVDPNEPTQESYSNITTQGGGQNGGLGTAQVYAELTDPNHENFERDDAGEVLSYDFGPDLYEPAYTYMKGDLTKAYSSKVEKFQRTFLFFNFFDDEYPAALIVFDNVKSADASFQKKWLLHTQEDAVVDEEARTITNKRTEFFYDGRLVTETLLPEKVTYTKIGGPGFEYAVPDAKTGKLVNFPITLKTTFQEAGNWRVEVSPAEDAKQDYFLHVLQVGDNDDSIVPLKSQLLENSDEYVGVAIKDRVAYFRKDGRTSYKDVVIRDTEADADRMYVVTSLAAGRWTAYDKSGNAVASDVATNDHDSISFTAKQGEYTLKWSYEPNLTEVDLTLPALLKFEPKENVDVIIDGFVETFEPGFKVIDDVVYAPVEESIQRLELSYTVENGVYRVNGETISAADGGTRVFDGVLYMNQDKLFPLLGARVRYDAFAKISRITYLNRDVDSILIHNYNDPKIAKVKKTTGSEATENAAFQAFDGGTNTYWYAPGDNEWIMAELEQEYSINQIDVWWNSGHTRQEHYEIFFSKDGENWVEAWAGDSKKLAKLGWEEIPISQEGSYKYVKFLCHGNTTNNKNSLCEVKIHVD